MLKITLSVFFLALIGPVGAQTHPGPFNSQNYPLLYDGRLFSEPEKRPVRDIEVIKSGIKVPPDFRRRKMSIF